MSTNYYLMHPSYQLTDGYITSDNSTHIGTSSVGWCFALHIIPEHGIKTLGDWIPLLKRGIILDEYGRDISFTDMLNIIANRNPSCKHQQECINTNHGEGSWDYITGEFS